MSESERRGTRSGWAPPAQPQGDKRRRAGQESGAPPAQPQGDKRRHAGQGSGWAPPAQPQGDKRRPAGQQGDKRRPAGQVGVRELRNQVAAVLRRAEAGDRVVVTVDGRPVAQLSPLEPSGEVTLDDLVAAGLVRPPGRSDKPAAPDPAVLPVDVRAERVIEEVRG